MDPKAINKAKGRLRVAEKAYSELPACPDYQTFTDTWYTLLVAAKNVYTVLEQGSKVSAPSRQWFGAKKQARKADDLLQYMFQARNDDEHGLEEVTKFDPGHIKIVRTVPGHSESFSIGKMVFGDGVFHVEGIKSHDGKPVAVDIKQPSIDLVPVIGPGPVTFNPPTTHLGQAIFDPSPMGIGRLYLDYLAGIIRDAEGLA